MANRRMFSLSVCDTDHFIDMPASSRLLYYELGLRADDYGFIQPKKIIRMLSLSGDDLKILIAKNYVIAFESGAVVITHWRINNEIKKDRKVPTLYTGELNQLTLTENKTYTLETKCLQNVSKMSTQDSIGEYSIGEYSIGEYSIGESAERDLSTQKTKPIKKFIKPSLEEIQVYCKQRKNTVDPLKFYNYYESNGWRVGKNPMKDWKAAIHTWERNTNSNTFTARSKMSIDII